MIARSGQTPQRRAAESGQPRWTAAAAAAAEMPAPSSMPGSNGCSGAPASRRQRTTVAAAINSPSATAAKRPAVTALFEIA